MPAVTHRALRPAAAPSGPKPPRARAAVPRAAMGSPAVATAPLASVLDLPPRYRALLLDQFGVLHDGREPYPGAIDAVRHLHSVGVKLLIISNSSRRAHGALGNLAQMGFPEEAFCGAITSGEVTHTAFEQRATPFWAARRRCLHFTWGARGAISLEGLGLEVTTDPQQADCIVAHGTEALGTAVDGSGAQPCSLEEMRALLLACAARQESVPMIVANPDVVTVHGAELRTMPGTLARWYAAAGGEVHLMGKPAGVIYERALRMLGLPADQVLAVGDSMEHDIAGAAGAGVDAAFVEGGIHAEELAAGAAGGGGEAALERLCQQHGVRPAFTLPCFRL